MPWPAWVGHEAAVERLTLLAATRDTPFIAARASHVRALIEGDAVRAGSGGRSLRRVRRHASGGGGLRRRRPAPGGGRVTAAGPRRPPTAPEPSPTDAKVPSTPALADLDAATPLTDRELDVALLAAQGHTNREVADELYLSRAHGREPPAAHLHQAGCPRPPRAARRLGRRSPLGGSPGDSRPHLAALFTENLPAQIRRAVNETTTGLPTGRRLACPPQDVRASAGRRSGPASPDTPGWC